MSRQFEGFGRWDWHAQGYWVMYGPVRTRLCATHAGARFRAWRLRRFRVPPQGARR